ncbi:hypothetical protein NQ315_012507 [Exocentrus adspersus]|uniref:Integrase catalytic domain-containing protein n=1 Tax=Exocentrus adspersus TaxID=1586481 RepID=A0AAV8V929_9CUCU|nr:hypothetical protein NQ315_012507 [Exocentrus adspersus]
MPEINFVLLKAFADTIPAFDGRTELLEFFISSADQFFNTYNTNDALLNRYILQVIRSKLSGRAQILIGARLELNSWEDVKSALRLNFGDPRDFGCLGAEMAAARPLHKESFADFGKRLQDMRSQIYFKINSAVHLSPQDKIVRLQMYDDSAYKTFIKHITERLRDRVLNRNANSLEDAIRIIREDENLRQELTLPNVSYKNSQPPVKPNDNNRNNYAGQFNTPQFQTMQYNLGQPRQNPPHVQKLPNIPPQRFPADQQNFGRTFRPNNSNFKSNFSRNPKFPTNQQVFGKQNVWKQTNTTTPAHPPVPMSTTSAIPSIRRPTQPNYFRRDNAQPQPVVSEELFMQEYDDYEQTTDTLSGTLPQCDYDNNYLDYCETDEYRENIEPEENQNFHETQDDFATDTIEQTINDVLNSINEPILCSPATLQQLEDSLPTEEPVSSGTRSKKDIKIISNIQLKPPVHDTDSQTQHTSLEEPTLTIPISEKCINSFKNQIILDTSDDSVAPSIQRHSVFDKLRLYVVIPTREFQTHLINFIKAFLKPKTTYGILFKNPNVIPNVCRIIKETFQNNSYKLIQSNTLLADVTNKDDQDEKIKYHHETKTTHKGINETKASLQKHYYWPNLINDVTTYINTCKPCQEGHYERRPNKIKFSPTPIGEFPLEHIYMDTFQIEKQKFLTIIDSFSRYAQAYPTNVNTPEILDSFISFISHIGMPHKITVDNSFEFKNEAFIEFCNKHKINIHFTTPANHTGNSPVERFHSTLCDSIRSLRIEGNKSAIPQLMKLSILGYNNAIHSVTKMTPFQIMFGRISKDPFDITTRDITTDYVNKHIQLLQTINETVNQRNKDNQTKLLEKANVSRHNPPAYDVNNPVYLQTENRNKADPKHKRIIIKKDSGKKMVPTKTAIKIKPIGHLTLLLLALTGLGQADITFTKIDNPLLSFSLGKALITTHKHTFVKNILHILDVIENAVLFSKLHILHSSILSAKEFMLVIKEIKQQYGETSIPDFSNMQSYYSLSSVEFYQKDNKLIFGIHMPILDSKSYDYFKLIPVPLNSQIVIPVKPYIILNNTWHHYEDLPCNKIEDSCIYFAANPVTSKDCLPKILTGKHNNTCTAKQVSTTTDIIESVDDNHVVIIPYKNLVVKQRCHSKGLHETSSPELASISPGCCITIRESSYCASRAGTEQPFELPKIQLDVSDPTQRTIKLPQDVSLVKVQEFVKNSEVLKVHDLLPMNFETNRHSFLIYVLISVAIILVSIYIYKSYIVPNKNVLYNVLTRRQRSRPEPKLIKLDTITDVCSTCIELTEMIKRCTDEEEKKNLLTEKRIHKLRANAFFQLLKEDREDLITLSFDCQKNLILPKVPDQTAYYSRQLYLYNFTIVQGTSQSKLTKQNVFSYHWTENEFGKGSNEISSAVFDRLNKIEFNPTVTTVRLMADGCSGQNKNTTLIGMCCKWLSEIAPEHVENVEVIFPVVGHSFLPADRVFGNIEKGIKQLEVITQPETYIELFSKNASVFHLGQNCSVFNWKQTVSDVLRPTGTWHFSFKNTKRFLLKKCKTGNVLIRDWASQMYPGSILRGLFARWKQVVYYDYDMPITVEMLHDIIGHAYDNGFIVVSTVCDLGPMNQKLFFCAQYLDLSVWILARLQTDSDLKIVPGLIQRMLTVVGSERQKVKWAARLLSKKVANGIRFLGCRGLLSEDPFWKETADFIELVNNWFDVCNASRKYGSHPGIHGYGVDLERQNDVLNRMTTMMSTMRVITSTKKSTKRGLVPFQRGIILNNMGLKEMLLYLQSKYNKDQSLEIKYILTRKLNQDILEQAFSTIRAMGRFNDNPSALSMKHRIRNYILSRHAATVLAANTKESSSEDHEPQDIMMTHDISSTLGLRMHQEVTDDSSMSTSLNLQYFDGNTDSISIGEWNENEDGNEISKFCVFNDVMENQEENYVDSVDNNSGIISLSAFHSTQEEELLEQFEKATIEQTLSDEAFKFVCGYVAHKYREKYSWLGAQTVDSLLNSNKSTADCDWISLISRGKLTQPATELVTVGRVMTIEFERMHGNDLDRKPQVFQRLKLQTITAMGNNNSIPEEVILCMARENNFKSLVDKNDSLRCVTSDAEHALNSIDITLHELFEDKKVIKRVIQYKALFEWPKLTEQSGIELRKLLEEMDSKRPPQILNLATTSSDELFDVLDAVDADYNIPSGSESDIGDTSQEEDEVFDNNADEIVVDLSDSEDDLPLSRYIATNITQRGTVTWGIHHISSVKAPADFISNCGLADEVERLSDIDSTPYKLFNLLITDEILDSITFQTNLYAEQEHQKTNKRYSQATVSEIKTFIGLNLLMGIKKSPSYRDYWSELKDKGIHACGTVMANRKNLPKLKDDKNLKQGEYDYNVSNDGISMVKWKDKRTVHLLSNFHDPQSIGEVKRKDKDGSSKQIPCPSVLIDYNKNMNCVDRFDQLKSTYEIDRKSKKWWMRIFWHFVDCSVVNSYILYKLKKLPFMSLKDFRRRENLSRKEVVMYLPKLDLLHHRISLLDRPVEDVNVAAQRQTPCDLNGHVPFVRLDYALEKQKIVFKDITQVVHKNCCYLHNCTRCGPP